VAFWISPKGLFAVIACLIWHPAGALWIAEGFVVVGAVAAAWLLGVGALAAYWDEVWRWGRLYAASPVLDAPIRNGVIRTLNWAGFHAGIVAAAVVALRRERKDPWLAWLATSLVGLAMGLRFFPRYYFQLLPGVVMLAARGFESIWGTAAGRPRIAGKMRLSRWGIVVLLAIPLVRFAPSYWAAATDPAWRDIRMDRESRAASAAVLQHAKPGDSLFVWGYRPEIYVYTGLPAATKFLDSQPLTGVPADRHLTQSEPVETEAPRLRRIELAHSQPAFIVDGLAPYNPHLAIGNYAELTNWLADYREIARAGQTVIYRRHPLIAAPK
jgi:hypothetical protein